MEGRRLAGRYQIASELGRGGMGVVYRARDESLDRDVALKVLGGRGKHHAELAARFEREARVVARFDHPNVLPVYDFGRDDEGLFLVMPLVEGDNLRALLSGGTLTLAEVLDVLAQVALGLAYSHERGVTHRDVKPENVMVERSPAGLRARLADFGLAVSGTDERLTRSGALVGTVAYLAPEQAVGAPLDGRTDIYALGTMLYECLAGALPFDGPIPSVLYRLVHEVPARPSAVGNATDTELVDLAMRCIAKDPRDRPASAREVAEALGEARSRATGAVAGRSVAHQSTVQVDILPRPADGAPGFVGRERELSEIVARLQRSARGECHVVLVGGVRGIGKTRLIDEVERLGLARGATVLRGLFDERGQSAPLQGFGELIASYLKRGASKLDGSAPSLADLEPDRIAQTFARIAEEGPLILLIEGLHGATSSIDVLTSMVRRLSQTPTLFVGTYATSDVGKGHPLRGAIAALEGTPTFARIELRPFALDENRAFVGACLGGAADVDVLARVHGIADGNPYLAREIVTSWREARAVVPGPSGRWVFAESAGAIELPQTVHDFVERRLERLPEPVRATAIQASVLGRSFDGADLEAVAEDGDDDLDDVIEKLLESGVLEEEAGGRADSDRLRFASGAVHEALYASIARRKRRTLHRRVAEHLEARHKGRIDAARAQLLHHYAAAARPAKVLEHGLPLAEAALTALRGDDAIRALRTVLEATESEEGAGDPLDVARARTALSRAHKLTGDIDAALEDARLAARAVASVPGDGAKRALVSALSAGADAAWSAGRVAVAAPLLDRALSAARELGDHAATGSLSRLRATVASLQGDLGTAQALGRESGADRQNPLPIASAVTSAEPVVVGLAAKLEAREPARIEYRADTEVLANVFETLITADAGGRLVPGLAARWEISDDGRRATFWLREGIQTHDGRRLEAADVKRSFERAATLGAEWLPAALIPIVGLRPFLERAAPDIGGIRVDGPVQLTFDLDPPTRIFPCMTIDMRTAVGCPDPRDPGGAWSVGTGPFRLEPDEPGRLVLVRHDAYDGGPRPRIERLEFAIGNTSAELARGFRAGRFDCVRELESEDAEDILRRRQPAASLVTDGRDGVWFLLWNRSADGAADEAFRRAVLDVVPLQELLEGWRGPMAGATDCLLAPQLLGHDPEARRPRMESEQAREILAVGPREPLSLLVGPGARRFHALVDSMVEAWQTAGIAVRIVAGAEGYSRAFERPAGIDLALICFHPDYPDPDCLFQGLFHGQAGWARHFWSSPDLDRLLEQGRAEISESRREALYRGIDADLAASGTVLPLWFERDFRLVSSRLHGFKLLALPPYVDFREAWKSAPTTSLAAQRREIEIPVSFSKVETDPSRAANYADLLVQNACFETLTREGIGAQVEPWLAESITPEAGARRFRIVLREGVRLHDGRLLTPTDVRSSLERMLRNSPLHHLLRAVRGAEAVHEGTAEHLAGFEQVSDRVFTIELDSPLPMFPAILASQALAISGDGTSFESGEWREASLGTGPFRVLRRSDTTVELEPAPHGWRSEARRCDRVVFRLGVSWPDMIEGVRSGRYAVAWSFSAGADSRAATGPSFVQVDRPPLSTSYVALCTVGVLADSIARRAVFAAVQAAAGSIAARLGDQPGTSIVPSTFLGAEPRRGSRPGQPPFRGDGKRLRIGAMAQGGRRDRILAALVPALEALGFEVEQVALSTMVNEDTPHLDVLATAWVAAFPDPDAIVSGLLQQVPFGFFAHPEVSRIADEARAEADPALRRALYLDLEEACDRLALAVPLFHTGRRIIASPRIRGLEDAVGMTRTVDPSLLYWDEEAE